MTNIFSYKCISKFIKNTYQKGLGKVVLQHKIINFLLVEEIDKFLQMFKNN